MCLKVTVIFVYCPKVCELHRFLSKPLND